MKGFNRIIAAYIAATLLVAVAAVASLWNIRQIDEASGARVYAVESLFLADALRDRVIDAETGQRGFSLTGDESFLQPYWVLRDNIKNQLQALRDREVTIPAAAHLDALAPLLATRMAQFADAIERRRRNDATADEAVATREGKQTMDLIRTQLQEYSALETRLLSKHRADFDSSMNRMFTIIMGICLLALLLAIAFAYLAFRETQHRLKTLVHQETQHLLGIQEDINKQLQQTNVNLHISEERLAVTLNSIDDAVIATDVDGHVTLLNPLAERLTGWTRAEATDRPVEEVFRLINADTRLPYQVPVQETLTHGNTLSLANHTIVIARDGTETHIADSCAPIRDRNGHVVGAVLVFRDVSERRHLDEILDEKNAALERATQFAEKANRAKSEFLSSMSHELRTPLSAVLGFAQLMDTGTPAPSASQKRSIDQILKAGWYLLDLINEILDLALIESGKLSLSIEPLSLADVMHECQTMIEPQAQKRNIHVVFPSLKDECMQYVHADRTRVKQVLINLLSNAIKYNSIGGAVTVDCHLPRPGRMRVSITDHGAGLSPVQVAQLFQPFNRLGQEVNAEEGTGIGLVMSKKLVELMGGEIGVESVVGTGSVFWFELNLIDKPEPVAVPGATPVLQAPGAAGARLRTLLYVEDNPANMMLVKDLVARRTDIQLLSALDGISGVATARASLPDVILMDINLPGISGIQAMQILAEDPATAAIPVVALSANAMPRDIKKGLESGFLRYLTKPIKVKEFMETLDLAFEVAEAKNTRAKPEAKT